jgi:hypothetical protein
MDDQEGHHRDEKEGDDFLYGVSCDERKHTFFPFALSVSKSVPINFPLRPRFYRDKPLSSNSRELQHPWTPFSNGVTTFYEAINLDGVRFSFP